MYLSDCVLVVIDSLVSSGADHILHIHWVSLHRDSSAEHLQLLQMLHGRLQLPDGCRICSHLRRY